MSRRSRQNTAREGHSLQAYPLVRTTPPELPSNFADKLLQLEFELETNCCIPLVTELMELYQQAIEYYEHMGDLKYIDLQTRLQKTLLRSDVMATLSRANSTPNKAKPHRALVASAEKMPEIPALISSAQTQDLIRRKKEELTRSLRPQATELIRERVSMTAQVSRSLNRMFESQETDTKDATKKAQKDVERQDEQLKNRLSQRVSSRKSSRNISPGAEKRSSNQDIDMEAVARRLDHLPSSHGSEPRRKYSSSAQLSPRNSSTAASSDTGENRMQNFDDLEKKLEEVMERSFRKKGEVLAEVRKKYEEEMRELEKEGAASGIMLQVLDQTRLTMEREIEETTKTLDAARREEVQQLRLQYIAQEKP